MLRAQSALGDMLSEFSKMIDKVGYMFHASIRVVIGEQAAKEVASEIYSKDKEVNEHERNIRRKILTHLSLNRGDDVPACLILMSIVKDAERIGDYCKNMFELSTLADIAIDHGRYKTPLREMAIEVEALLGMTKKAFESSNESMSRQIIARGEQINGQCNMLIKQLVADNIPTAKAIVYTLAIRYIKRISSHLTNIATSIVNSLDNLDFSNG
jgi:phosphate transport system protein